MKNILLLILSIVSLLACNTTEKPLSKEQADVVKQVEPLKAEKKDIEPKTITLREVSRIALVEAKQFVSLAKNKGVDFAEALTIYKKANKAYENAEYKKAQILAVEVRQNIEKILNK